MVSEAGRASTSNLAGRAARREGWVIETPFGCLKRAESPGGARPEIDTLLCISAATQSADAEKKTRAEKERRSPRAPTDDEMTMLHGPAYPPEHEHDTTTSLPKVVVSHRSLSTREQPPSRRDGPLQHSSLDTNATPQRFCRNRTANAARNVLTWAPGLKWKSIN
ncbi:hypothetical protein AAFF_G00412740 [Aldrovandia affinis]|uniref:Uncharacterized protein n=1 Tax=Aldrovandia affinis TaxID=143900 RepID=A0AAD7WJE4_9TELE|nr:hypothetical protein AAFF_G00412740 [Aldrovandia affinis]